MNMDQSCAIFGAGMAGLTAAEFLQSKGWTLLYWTSSQLLTRNPEVIGLGTSSLVPNFRVSAEVILSRFGLDVPPTQS